MMPTVLPPGSRAHAHGPDHLTRGSEATGAGTTFADLLGLAVAMPPAETPERTATTETDTGATGADVESTDPVPAESVAGTSGPAPTDPIEGELETGVDTDTDAGASTDTPLAVTVEMAAGSGTGRPAIPATDRPTTRGADADADPSADPISTRGRDHGIETAIAHAAAAAGLDTSTPGPDSDRGAARASRPDQLPHGASRPAGGGPAIESPATEVPAPHDPTPTPTASADGSTATAAIEVDAPAETDDSATLPAEIDPSPSGSADVDTEEGTEPELGSDPSPRPTASAHGAARTQPSEGAHAVLGAATLGPAGRPAGDQPSPTAPDARPEVRVAAPTVDPTPAGPVHSVTTPSAVVPAAAAAAPPPPAPVAPQIVQHVTPLIAGGDGTHELTIELDPVDLGRLRLEITLDDGVVSIRVHAEDAGTRRLMAGSMAELRTALAEAGITAGDLDVRDGAPDPRDRGDAHHPSMADASLTETTPARQRTRPSSRSALDVLL